MPPKAEDRRVRRTKQLLQRALISLTLERGYESLTIQDIAARADVGRSTFYAHFGSKDELFMSNFDDLEEAMAKQQRAWRAARGERTRVTFGFSLPLLQHIHEHRQVYHAIVGRPSGEAMEQRLRGLVTRIVREDLRPAVRAEGKVVTPFDAVVTFVVGAFLAVVFWWLDHAPNRSAEEVDGIFHLLTLPGVEAVLGSRPGR